MLRLVAAFPRKGKELHTSILYSEEWIKCSKSNKTVWAGWSIRKKICNFWRASQSVLLSPQLLHAPLKQDKETKLQNRGILTLPFCIRKNQQLVTEEQKSNSTTVNVKKSPVALLLVNMTGQKPQRASEAQQMSLYHSARCALSPQPRLPWFPLIVFSSLWKSSTVSLMNDSSNRVSAHTSSAVRS